MSVIKFVIWVTAAYFIGNISPSILLGKAKGVDIKKEGSGNAGTTNALRVLGKKAAVITLIIDVCKGVLAVYLGMKFGNYTIGTVCALAVFCGHVWPCFYRFKGGKGVATAFGAILAVQWYLALIELLVVATLLAAAAFPLLCWLFEPGFLPVGCVMAVIIIIKHIPNIKRLIKGQEPKMFSKKEEQI